ncbi:MAG: hypothetical protein M3144_13160 [Actinomycetota bacterium]|nr:hypothetical protein [Actinomycetota bacterium]
MTEPETAFEIRLTRNHTVILLVSVLDRRILPAIRFVSRLGSSDSRALHVSVDAQETRRLAVAWMRLGLSWLPLHIREASAESLPVAVRDAVRDEAPPTVALTVVVPELVSPRWWYPLLHRRSARRIAAELQTLPRVTAVIVPFCFPPRGEAQPTAKGAAPDTDNRVLPLRPFLDDGSGNPAAPGTLANADGSA